MEPADQNNSGSVKKRRSKWNNKRVIVNGISFMSQKEADRYPILLAQQERGEIFDLKLQPRFTLQEAFIDNTGVKQPAIVYVADYAYRDWTGDLVVEDVKGSWHSLTDVFRLKERLFRHKYPEIDFRLVGLPVKKRKRKTGKKS